MKQRKHKLPPPLELSDDELNAPLPEWSPYREKPFYIALHKNGFGISQCPATAIRRAQESVELKAKPTQLLLYSAATEIDPVGFVKWPANGEQPKLVGLTNTHQLWRPKWSIAPTTAASIKKEYEWATD